MLVRIEDEGLCDLPDSLAASILADPSYGDTIADLEAEDVNMLIHSALAALYNPTQSFAQNVTAITNRYASIEKPTQENLQKAVAAVDTYKKTIKETQVGYVDANEMFQFNTASRVIDESSENENSGEKRD